MNATPPAPSGDSAEKARRPRGRFNPKTVTLLIAASIITGLAIAHGGPQAYQWWVQRQARSLTAEAAQFIQKGSWDKAIKILNRAYQKDPKSPDLLRLLAKTFDQTPGTGDRSSFFWKQVVATPAATLEDRTALGAALMREGLGDEARALLEALPPADQQKISAVELRATILRSELRADEAERMLRAAYAADSGTPSSRRKLATLDLASSFSEVQDGAVRTLWEIARSSDDESLKAALAVASHTRLTPAQAADLRSLLVKLPSPTEEQRYTILSGVIRALPQERDPIIRDETGRQKKLPAEDSAEFYRWLEQSNEHDRILKLLSARDATRSAGLFLVYASALEQTRRWKELRDFVRKSPALLVPPMHLALILARCSRGLGESDEILRNHLQEAFKHASAARNNPGLLQVGITAEKLGHPEISIEVFNRLATIPQFRLPALERTLQIRHRECDLPAMLEIIGRCLEARPDFPGYVETSCYLKLLGGTDMEIAAATIRRLSETTGAPSPGAHLVQALSAYRHGDLETARQETASVNASKLPPGQRAVLAGILRACGRTSEAFQIAEKIPKSILLDEETRFLRSAL